MANMILATPVYSDAATLSASNSPAGLSVGNLQKSSIGEVWRALDASAAYVVADLGASKPINLVALLGHTGSSRSFGRIRAASTEAALITAPAYDSGNIPLRSHQSGYDAAWAAGITDEQYGALETNHFLEWIQTSQNYRFWRIDIVDPLASYIDVGRLYISDAWQPITNMNYGMGEGFIDPSKVARTAGGRLSATERKKYRFTEFGLSFSNQNEMYDHAFEIDRLRGTTRDVLYIQDPEATNHLQRRSIYGVMKGMQPIINSNFSIFEKSYRIEEIIE